MRNARAPASLAVEHITTDDIFGDLGFSPAEAQQLRIKSDLLMASLKRIRQNKMTQAVLAKAFFPPQQVNTEPAGDSASPLSRFRLSLTGALGKYVCLPWERPSLSSSGCVSGNSQGRNGEDLALSSRNEESSSDAFLAMP
jgi:hypothetical protein